MPVLGAEDLVDLGPEELGDDPRLVRERGLDLARDLLELVAHELRVDGGLLALQHARADLDRVGHDLRPASSPASIRRSTNAAVGGIVDDDVLDDHPPHQDVDAGLAEGRGGFHGSDPTLRGAPDRTVSEIAEPREPLGLPLRAPRAASRRVCPVRRARSPPSPRRPPAAPSKTASTVPSACCAPTRPRRGARPPGASSRGRRRPAHGHERPLGGAPDMRYRRQMTALEGELDACGGADAPPSAAARLREVLAEACATAAPSWPSRARARSEPVEVAIAAHDGILLAAMPAAAALRADPDAVAEREWLLVAAVVGTLVELAEPGPPVRPRRPPAARRRAARRLSRPRLSRRRASTPSCVDARLRRARRARSTACAHARWRCRRA